VVADVGDIQMKLKKTIRTFVLVIASFSAFLYTVDSIAGIIMAKEVERRIGQKLLTLADNPNLGKLTVEEFFSGLPRPSILHKQIFVTRQVMQRLSCDGIVFFFSMLIGYMMRDKKRQQGGGEERR